MAGAEKEEESCAGARAVAGPGEKSNTVNTGKVVIYQYFNPLAVLPKPKPGHFKSLSLNITMFT